jgi:hypothetical protein
MLRRNFASPTDYTELYHRRWLHSPLPLLRTSNSTRFELFTAVTIKKSVFWDIRTQFMPHRRHITSPLDIPAGYCFVTFEVFMEVTMKNVVFWDVTPSRSFKNWRFRGTYRLHHQGDKKRRARNDVKSD